MADPKSTKTASKTADKTPAPGLAPEAPMTSPAADTTPPPAVEPPAPESARPKAGAARPFKPPTKRPEPAKQTFARPIPPEVSGKIGGGPDRPARPFTPPVRVDVEGKGPVTAAVSVGGRVEIGPGQDPGHSSRPRNPVAAPPPPEPVAQGMVTDAVPAAATMRVRVSAVPLKEGEATTPDYVPPAFRWPPRHQAAAVAAAAASSPAPAPSTVASPVSGLAALAAAQKDHKP